MPEKNNQRDAYVEAEGREAATAEQLQRAQVPEAEWTGAEPHRIELREERLRVEREQEEAGTVRVSRQVRERVETVTVPIREEWVIIERLHGSGPVLIGDRELDEGETIELAVMREQIQVNKAVVMTEDITLAKETFIHNEQIRETLRKEDLAVEDTQGLVVDRRETARAPLQSATAGISMLEGGTGATEGRTTGQVSGQPGSSTTERTTSGAEPSPARAVHAAHIEGARVVTADGHYVGRVRDRAADRFLVDAPMQPDFWLPNDSILHMAEGEIHLSFPKSGLDEAKL